MSRGPQAASKPGWEGVTLKMKTRYVSDLRVGDPVEDIFYVKSCKALSFKNKPGSYLRIQLADRTGIIEAKLWEYKPEVHMIPDKAVIRCAGEVVEFAENPEIHIRSYQLIDLAEVDRAVFLPLTPLNIEEMQKQVREMAASISNPFLRQLLSGFIQDSDLFPKFSTSPAAKMVHQAYLGGLLEHSLNTARIVKAIAGMYPAVNLDIALTGALLHDIGKIGEYEIDFSIEVSDEGRLLGHIVLGLEVLDSLMEKVPDFPRDLRMALRHIVASHHGRYEWQSPKRPKTIEACLVHYADAVEADMWKFSHLKEQYPGEKWSPWERSLERYIFLG